MVELLAAAAVVAYAAFIFWIVRRVEKHADRLRR